MPNIPFEPTNSWCYTFARYQVLPEILAMREVAAGEPFRLVEMVKKVMDKHLTEQEQATKYVRRDTGKPLSISATVKFYVPFVGKKTEQLIPLGDGMYRLPSVADVEAAAGEVEEAAAGTIDEDGEVVDFDGWVYAFSFPTLVRENDRYPIKIGMTVVDVEGRVMGQCRSSATFDRPVVLNKWQVKRVAAVESAIHHVLKARGQWREQALGNEWFDSRPEEIEEILRFVVRV